MSVATISLNWGLLSAEALASEKQAVYRNGKINNPNLALGWNVKLCGFNDSDRKKLIRMLDSEERFINVDYPRNMIYWVSRREQYDPRSKRLDETQMSTNDNKNLPMEFITKYLAKLTLLGYAISSALSVIDVDATLIWTLTKKRERCDY